MSCKYVFLNVIVNVIFVGLSVAMSLLQLIGKHYSDENATETESEILVNWIAWFRRKCK